MSAVAILGSEEEAADAVQTAMMRIWNGLGVESSPENPKAYCLATLRNICLTALNNSHRYCSLDEMPQRVSETCNVEDALGLQAVTEALRRLPQKERQAVELSAYGGCSALEIARALDVSEANARQILCRGRRHLREFFKERIF